jgi:hypothetical protein
LLNPAAMRRTVLMMGFLVAACSAGAAVDDSTGDFPHDGVHLADSDGKDDDGDLGPIKYKGGPVMHDPVVIDIYWGSWWQGDEGAADIAVLDELVKKAGESKWWALAAEYPDADGPPGTLQAGDSVIVTDEPGDVVTDRHLRSFIVDQITNDVLAWDDQSLYVVFTPPGTVVSTPWGKSCEAICAYHYHFSATIDGKKRDVKYASIPYGACPADCGVKGVSANGKALDQMTVDLSHELMESVTDPDINAWTGPHGEDEVADRCDSGFVATWSGSKFAVQDIWSNAAMACAREP